MSNYSIAKGLNPDSTIVSSPDQVSCDLGGEAAILNLKTGVYSGLDPVGARIWALLSKPTTLGGLSEAISAEYDITPERCEADIRELLIQLENAGLVLVNSPGAPGKEHLSVRHSIVHDPAIIRARTGMANGNATVPCLPFTRY